ncbi:Hint domain-containing protein [Roseovarius sp. MMSF_3281]|uniref:Hint domain-containing protein n=1 Tax=Roseovarius sp. MMSF_3281 TaxID=3046694 RepID=UPI00273F09A6|nr:Hint domain-containing protein [Roseovarius sp. MMSF_3281]
MTYRDGDGNGTVGSTSTNTSHTNDGVAIDGSAYNVSHHWSYKATITYSDGTTLETTIMAMRLVDDPDQSGTGDYHGKLVFRLHDNAIDNVYNGDDGAGGNNYPLAKLETITITDYVNDVAARSMSNALADDYPVCLTRGVLIKTDKGEVKVEDLKIGDHVLTVDHGFQRLRWIGSRKISKDELKNNGKLKPVLIKAGALAAGWPEHDLLVSPQHRIFITSRIAHRITGFNEVLIPAKKLAGYPGVQHSELGNDVEYFHLLFDSHELIWSNGAITESLYVGPQALKALPPESLEEIQELFPGVFEPDFQPSPARPFLQRKGAVKSLISRHLKHHRPMVGVVSRSWWKFEGGVISG